MVWVQLGEPDQSTHNALRSAGLTLFRAVDCNVTALAGGLSVQGGRTAAELSADVPHDV